MRIGSRLHAVKTRYSIPEYLTGNKWLVSATRSQAILTFVANRAGRTICDRRSIKPPAMELRIRSIGLLAALPVIMFAAGAVKPQGILNPDSFQHYIEQFNRNDVETTRNYVPNQSAWAWLRANIPMFECSDKALEEMYYFRWWTFRKHISETPQGFVITEFLPPVPWAGEFNTISCSAAHHFYEGGLRAVLVRQGR
jgi:hypothetical protein